ncbi:MAG TPA: FAD-linked oxidase C-terminal domain-containing protein, partial [Thermomicrobiaceae bacterium]|nr:FAD-linked oxidase C-terminal domain-containing protein [Thermomicrobiaceae bacterium]
TIPLAVEFLDRPTIDAIEAWGVAKYSPDAVAVVLLDLEGTAAEVRSEAEAIRELAVGLDAVEVAVAHDEEARNSLWLGRRGAFASTRHQGKRILTQDITVPRQHLTDMLMEVDRIGAHYGIPVSTKGHAGDGNLHPDLPFDPDDPDMTRRVHQANEEILHACVALGGSISGEHGIGSDKLQQLPIMYGPSELGLMWAVKQALDPTGILNPGKAVLPVPRARSESTRTPADAPETVEDLQAMVLQARERRRPLRLSLDAFHDITPDLENLTITVGSGVTLDEIDAALAATPLCLPVRPLRSGNIARALLTNDYGPEHLSLGTFRRTLLATDYVTGAGEIVRMGRSIVKNVAGYDLFRPLIGSRGRLGIPVSLTFRLVPKPSGKWQTRQIDLADMPKVLAAAPEAIFALPAGRRLDIFARLIDPPAGWRPAPEAGSLPDKPLSVDAGLLDLAFSPHLFTQVMALLPAPPLLILPAAARLLLPIDESRARDITAAIAALGRPLRATWGPDLTPLSTGPPDLASRWEDRLRQVFDPDGILSIWLLSP